MPMKTILMDTREKPQATELIMKTFKDRKTPVRRTKLYVGDYQTLDNPFLVIDRKQSLLEVCQNVCQDHVRFAAELQRAKDDDIHLIILVEHGHGLEKIQDVKKWANPRLKTSPLALTGERLYKIMRAIEVKYGIEWRFCTKEETGNKILMYLEADKD